jgi:NADH-quinone oxidoreductase subunit J
METAAFALFALLAVASAVVVVAHRNPVYSTMSLVITLLSTAALFVMLGSAFLAALQILLYTGAILVLFLFVIMLLNVGRESRLQGRMPAQTWIAAIGALLLFGALARLLHEAHAGVATEALTEEFTATAGLADLLFSSYLLPFEIIGLLLLVAVVAASWVARRPSAEEEENEEASR